ncbi:MAG: T9SS type A sorting domain-containing protein [bacterium]|nr:T9SS type A sorting domain-containing protein [bacterium]
MKKTVLIIAILCCGIFVNAQTKYGFNNALAYDNWNNNDTAAGVELVVWVPNNDTLEITTGSDVTAIDGSARNGFEYNFTGVKLLFQPGTNIFDFSNQKKLKYNFTPNTTFFGERDFYIKLSNVQGITVDDFYNNRDLMRVVIDYDGTNVGVKKLSVHSYRLYPVPTSGSLFVEGANPSEFKVYDLSGRLAASGAVMQNRIDVSEIGNGLYVLYAQTDKGLIVQKFLKN